MAATYPAFRRLFIGLDAGAPIKLLERAAVCGSLSGLKAEA
jgi:hypothetical protein